MKLVLVLALLLAPATAAAQRNYIASPTGQRLGYIEASGDRLKAYNASGQFLGYYERSTDTTRSASGRVLARGNALAALIIDL